MQVYGAHWLWCKLLVFAHPAIVTHLRNQNLVSSLHAHGNAVTLLIKEARANGEDLCRVLVLHGALREENAGSGLALGLDSLDKDTVQEGDEVLDVAEGLETDREQALVCHFSRYGC